MLHRSGETKLPLQRVQETTGVSQQQAEDIVRRYHITGSAKWGELIANRKAEGKAHDDLGGSPR